MYVLRDHRFVLINRKFEEMFGVTLEDVNRPEFDMMDLVAPRCRTMIEERRRRVASGEETSSRYEFTALTRDGREVEVESSVAYLRCESGTVVLGSLRDVSHRWVIEQQLLRAGRVEAIDKVASEVAHDLSDLLTIVGGYAELLIEALPEDESLRSKARKILAGAQDAASLTHRVRALCRPAGTSPTRLDLGRTITELHTLLGRLLGRERVLVCEPGPKPVPVVADAALLEHLLMLLAVNARDAVSPDSTLTIEARREYVDEETSESLPGRGPGWHAVLSLAEHGPRLRAPVFNDRRNATGAQGRSGSGGLDPVRDATREIVEELGAVATVRETSEGTTAVRIYFPLADAALASSGQGSDLDTESLDAGTILVVDDQEGIRDVATMVLRRAGYEVITAVDGAQAIRVADSHDGPIDLLITDVVMPVLGGAGLSDALLPGHPEMGVLFMSGYPRGEIEDATRTGSGTPLLRKPFSAKGLLETVREVLG